ncbi:hypothetical protein GGH92_010260, partial [Coemansia sp. RSA 2673]
ADSPETSPSISAVSRNLSSLFQGTPAPAPVDPHFEVVDSGHGSLVLAKLPPYSQLYAQVGQTLGQSPRARSRATTRGAAAFLTLSTWNAIGAAFNPLAFDKLSGRGSAVINAFGGLHRLVLREGEDYLVDPRFVVAWSSTLRIVPQSGRPKPLSPHAVTATASESDSLPHQSTAPAAARPVPLVASSPALDNRVSQPAKSPTEAAQKASVTSSAAEDRPASDSAQKSKGAMQMVAAKVYTLGVVPAWRAIKNAVRTVAYASANAARVGGGAAAKATRSLAGVPDLCRVTGPGDIYVSTRLAPRPWTRLTNTIAAKSSAAS